MPSPGPHPWLIRAIDYMQTEAPRRMTAQQLVEAIGAPRVNRAHKILYAAEINGHVHSIGQAAERRYTVGQVPLPLPAVREEAPTSLIGRNAPRVPSVWAWVQVQTQECAQ